MARRGWSILVMSLMGGMGLGACSGGSGGGGPGTRYVALFDDLANFQCQCAVDAGEVASVEQCLDLLAQLGNGLFPTSEDAACIDQALSGNAEATAAFNCALDASDRWAACEKAKGCEAFLDDEPEVPCNDGSTIPESWVCDGFDDCSMGEDEQDCPGPFMCGDGTEVPAADVCDGSEDCADGTDEMGCPETCETIRDAEVEACGAIPSDVEAQLEDCLGDAFGGAEDG